MIIKQQALKNVRKINIGTMLLGQVMVKTVIAHKTENEKLIMLVLTYR